MDVQINDNDNIGNVGNVGNDNDNDNDSDSNNDDTKIEIQSEKKIDKVSLERYESESTKKPDFNPMKSNATFVTGEINVSVFVCVCVYLCAWMCVAQFRTIFFAMLFFFLLVLSVCALKTQKHKYICEPLGNFFVCIVLNVFVCVCVCVGVLK